MGVYRLSRNVEASILDYITAQLTTDGWTGISVVKGFPQKYKGKTPIISIESLERPVARLEIGGNGIYQDINVSIRIFATSDGQRLDLADWLINKLVTGIDYYIYTISGGVATKVLTGKIVIQTPFKDNRKDLTNTENLEEEDRYRHLITIRCRVAI